MEYLDKDQLPFYRDFKIDIEKVNQIDVSNDEEALELDITNGETLYVKSVILFERTYVNYFLVTSTSRMWWHTAENAFRIYLNNDDLEFFVANSSQLIAVAVVDDVTETSIVFWIITSIIFTCVMGAICVSMLNKRKRQCCYPVDNQNWVSLLLFVSQFMML